MTCSGVYWFETPVVEDEQLHTAEHPQDTGLSAVAAGKGANSLRATRFLGVERSYFWPHNLCHQKRI